jgi:NRPS condensation-like uncharacterized protein
MARSKMGELRSVKKNIVFPLELVHQANAIAKELKIGFSELIREALWERIRKINKEKIAKGLEEEARANNDFYRSMRKDWQEIDIEAWK